MKGEDIDKIFRDALGEYKAPTNESDWAAFEGMLNTRKGGISKWAILALVLFLIGGSVSAVYFYSQPTAQYTARESQTIPSGTKTSSGEKNLNDNSTQKSASTLEQKINSGHQNQTIQGAKDQESKMPEEIHSANEQSNSDNEQKAPKINSSTQNIAAFQMSNFHENTSRPASDNYSTRSNLRQSEGIPGNAGSITSGKAEIRIPKAEMELAELEKLIPLSAEFNHSITPNLKGTKRNTEELKTQRFTPLIYIKLEQNNVLKTTVAAGIAVQRNIANFSGSSLSMQAGIGFQRTGRLNWNVERTVVYYGFDRYENVSALKTKQLDMIQIPLKLTYQKGVHRIFAGAELNWIVNANQELRQGTENANQSGYLYDSGAPKMAIFYQLGYGYALNEKLQLDVGMNLSGQKWKPVEKSPVGGFVKLNYFIR